MKAGVLFLGLLLVLCCASAALGVPSYSIVPLGFTDAEHTRSDGYEYSEGIQLNEAGQVSGISRRYNGGSNLLGYSAWLYDGATTRNIGLTGAEHTGSSGYKLSEAHQLNEAGQVSGSSQRFMSGGGFSAWLYDGATTRNIGLTGGEHTHRSGFKFSDANQLNEAGQVSGYSRRYNGSNSDLGRSAWLYDGATTRDIGLTGMEHTRSGGYKYSNGFQLNEAGQVSGISHRYNGGSTDLGRSAWLYDGTTTRDIGLTGGEHTHSSGFKSSFGNELNEAGQVRGVSSRYNGGTYLGQSAWLYDGTTTRDIGLTDAEHTRDDGYKFSEGIQLNGAGQASGKASRYDGGSTDLGLSAWLYDGATTRDIGLTGAEHTRDDGYRLSEAHQLNEAGQVSGYSGRYDGGSMDLGTSAWLYDGVTTRDIGLTGAEHTRNDGYKLSVDGELNEAGQVSGISQRYNGGSMLLGQSVWLYDGSTTRDIGLTGAEHTRHDGYRYSFFEIDGLNAAGQVAGYSERYNGGSTLLGRDAWLYDPVLDQTFALQLAQYSEGYAYSSVEYLGDDGLVLGSYRFLDALDDIVRNRAFYFTVADGLHDLGALVDGGLSANGWGRLAGAIRENGLGQILGHGKLASQSAGQMAYLLTPTSADFDEDEDVDEFDLADWEAAYGVDAGGDANNDGVTDGRDFLIWQRQVSPSTPLGADSVTVPEPGGVVLGLLAVGCLPRRLSSGRRTYAESAQEGQSTRG